MKTKKVISLLLCAVIIISSILSFDYISLAVGNPTVYSNSSNTEINAGETVRIPISIRDNSGLMGWKLIFNYDKDFLTPTSVDYGDVISGGIQDNIEGDSVPGSFNVYWAGSDSETYNGIMFYINFTVNSSAVGNTNIDVSYSQPDTFDGDFNDAILDCKKIALSVENTNYRYWIKTYLTQIDDESTLSGTYNAGDNIFLTVRGQSSDEIPLTYEKDCIEFDSSAIEFVSFIDNNYEPVTLNGMVVYDDKIEFDSNCDADALSKINGIQFRAKDNAKKGCYSIKYSLVGYEGAEIDYNESIPFLATIIPTESGSIANIYSESSIKAQNGDTISVPVKIDNNHGIMGYRITVRYNPEELEIVSVDNSSDFPGTFNDSIGSKTGEFDVLWNSTSEVIKDATLFTLNFNVITTTNTTSKIELSYTQADTFNEEYKDVVFDCHNINISLNAECEHDYVSEITKSPTCKETGIRTYTCSKCGDTYTEDTEKAPHSYGEWTYNGDAKYNSSSSYTNGTQSRTCTACGEAETVEAPNTALLRRRGNALALESSITLTTYITKDIVDYYDEVYAEFTRNNKTQTVYASEKTFTSGSTVYSVFDYKGISPQAMGDDIEITFYGIKDGVKYWGETYTYSVTTYVQSTLSKSTASSKLKTMLVDLMYYGAACQTYSNYKTDALMTDILTDEQKQLKSNYTLELSNIKNSSYETCENRLVRFGTALRLNNAVEIALPLNMTNVSLDELTIKVKIGTRELTYTYAENPENFEKGSDGYWYFYFDGVYANQMSDEVFIRAFRGSEQVSYTLKYSVESYAATVTDSKLKAVTDAMMYYGNSAKAYAGN